MLTAHRQEFLDRHPEYAETLALDELRAREFERLDRAGEVYLDYTGSGLYGASQVRKHAEWLLAGTYGNPHSESPTALASCERVERCRGRVLDFFRADPAEYAVAFTANASHALKLVGEAYPSGPQDRLLLTFDNHNSVNGIREYFRAHGACTRYVPLRLDDLRVDEGELDRHLADPGEGNNLFAYPAQSNFSGVRHPLEWIDRARQRGWDVLLDAAAFVPTARLDLSRHRPDFVVLSFYKMFGYPTGVGALLARREALARLHRPWFAGGTIRLASVQADRFLPAAPPACFEDGTPDFVNIPAVELGLDLLDSVGYETLGLRCRLLTSWLLDRLALLRHGNGQPAARLYGPATTEARGGTVAFNFLDPQGRQVDHAVVERRAAAHRISLRTGCFCNPGASELALGLTAEQMSGCMDRDTGGTGCGDLRRCLDPRGAGAVRVSFGLASSYEDLHRFLEMAEGFVDTDPTR